MLLRLAKGNDCYLTRDPNMAIAAKALPTLPVPYERRRLLHVHATDGAGRVHRAQYDPSPQQELRGLNIAPVAVVLRPPRRQGLHAFRGYAVGNRE